MVAVWAIVPPPDFGNKEVNILLNSFLAALHDYTPPQIEHMENRYKDIIIPYER